MVILLIIVTISTIEMIFIIIAFLKNEILTVTHISTFAYKLSVHKLQSKV